MSPEKTSQGGRFRTDWQRREIGRIRVTWGHTEKEHARAVHLLDELYENGQFDVLRALKKPRGDAGRVEIGELLAAKKAGRHKRDDVLVDVRLRRGLWETFAEAVKQRPGGDKHHARLLSSLKKFARSSAARLLGPKAIVADLRRVDWRVLRGDEDGHGGELFRSAADWNHMRKAISSALSTLLDGPAHPFRLEIMKRIPRETETAHDVDVTVEQFIGLVALIPEQLQPIIVTLAVTGMRLETEYLACRDTDKRPLLPGVYCPGSKTADASGVIPVAPSLWHWVNAGIPAPRKAKQIRVHFHRACVTLGLGRYEETGAVRVQTVRRARDGAPSKGEPTGIIRKELPVLRYKGLRLHDLRHLALQLALDGGAALNDVQRFARHADPTMTMRYLQRSSTRQAADAIGKMLPSLHEKKG